MRKAFILLLFHTTFMTMLMGQNIDIKLLRDINLGRNTSLNPALRVVTNSITPLAIGTPVIIFGIGYLKNDSLLKQNALYVGATMLTAALITNIIKYSVNRPRPFETYPDIEKVARAGSPSFPSGHTSNAFSLATSLSLSYPKWYIIVPSYLWAATVAYSRMDLGVHYPSDIIIGAVIGAGSAYLCYKINKKIRSCR